MKKESSVAQQDFFRRETPGKILFKIAPPVMLAQLIQALYNIVDSFFVGRYSDDALTAVSVIYPIQLIIVAIAVGTGVGVNTYMAREDALDKHEKANAAAGTGTVLALLSWTILALLSVFLMPLYVKTSATEQGAITQATTYGLIVCVGSVATLLEGTWTKVLQARGNMRRPMIAQIAGALTNVILDPLLIFGMWIFPELGIAGAAIATISGQFVSAAIVAFGGLKKPPAVKDLGYYIGRIYRFGYASIVMQLLYTVYIVMLNMILAGFSDSAVTVLGLYYKAQSFFFIPLFGLQTCIVPVISYNFACAEYGRCRKIMRDSYLFSVALMVVGMVCFIFFPQALMRVFTQSEEVMQIGLIAFPIIGSSFMSAVFSLMTPVFFQAIGKGLSSLLLTLTRQIFVLVPVFWAFSKIGLNFTWLAFPIAETTAGALGLILYAVQIKKWNSMKNVAH